MKLTQAGFAVDVFEKSRGPGGRMSTRRRDGQTFDHGAQFFRTHSDAFKSQVAAWEKQGVVAPWTGRFGVWANNDAVPDTDDRTRWVGLPKMNAIARGLSGELEVHWESRVVGLHRHAEGWTLRLENRGTTQAYFGIVLSCPGPQAAALCPVDSVVHKRARSLRYAPCWALMAEFQERLAVEYDGIRSEGPLSWVARDSSKPGRPGGERWVIHASAEFSQEHVESSRAAVGEELSRLFVARFGGELKNLQVHLWRYALAETSEGAAFEWDAQRRLGLIGDALVGARVEAAWQSGRKLASAIVESECAPPLKTREQLVGVSRAV